MRWTEFPCSGIPLCSVPGAGKPAKPAKPALDQAQAEATRILSAYKN